MKKNIIIIILVVIVSLLCMLIFQKKVYKIKTELIDEYTVDLRIKVYLNDKEFNDYQYIKYNDDSNMIICYANNPVVNKYEIENINKLIIVLSNGDEKVVEVLK